MPQTTAISNGKTTERQTPSEHDLEQNPVNGSGKKGRGSPFMHSLLPEMVAEPRPLDFADGMNSYEFALEKCRRFVIAPLEFKSQKEWLDFAKQAWAWVETAAERQAKTEAERLISEIQNMLDANQDPKVNQLLKEELTRLAQAF